MTAKSAKCFSAATAARSSPPGEDNTSRLWSLNFTPEGKFIGANEVSRIPSSGAASVTADLRYLATADSDAVRIWWLKPEDLIFQLQARLFRNLTRLEWELYFGKTPYRKTCPNLPEQPVEQPDSPEAETAAAQAEELAKKQEEERDRR